MDARTILHNVREVSARFAAERRERHQRQVLVATATGRICRVMGGGTFSRSSPFGHWHEDMRALGFLRPPWGLVYDNLYGWSVAPVGMRHSSNTSMTPVGLRPPHQEGTYHICSECGFSWLFAGRWPRLWAYWG